MRLKHNKKRNTAFVYEALVRELTDAFVNAAGGTPESVNVVITDVDKTDWGSGGELCSDKFPD